MTTADAPAAVLDLSGERTPARDLLADLFRHRDLLRMLAAQDYRGRYRSASLGLAWSVLLPVLQGLIIAIVFSRAIGAGRGASYVSYVIIGMTVWSYMQQSLIVGCSAIVDNGAIAGRIYFPRLTLPAIAPTANVPGVVVSLLVAEVVTLATGAGVHLTLLLAPVALALAWLLTVVLAAVTTLAHVYSRDVRYVVQAGMLILFYATPVIYQLGGSSARSILPHFLRPLVIANPFTGVVELARYALLGQANLVALTASVTCAWVVAVALVALASYSRLERVACDRL